MAREKEKHERKTAEQVIAASAEKELVIKEAAAVNEETSADAMELSELEIAAREWQKEKEELFDSIKRKQADLDNLRRISKQEQVEAREYALSGLLCRLLPVLDNLERGLESARSADDVPAAYCEGLEMIHRQLLQLIEQEEVSIIETVGSPFDPNCHQAVAQEDHEDSEPGTVLEELQKGYRHRKRILRPAMVKICRE